MLVFIAKDFHGLLGELMAKYRLAIDYDGGVVLRLQPEQRRPLLNAITTELEISGLRPDGASNARGLLLEGLIDQVNRHADG